MSALTDRIADEHHYMPRRRYKLCACGDVLGDYETMRHHVAVKVEAAVREQVAREIDAIAAELRNNAIRKMDQTYEFGAEGLDIAARIARGAS